MLRTRQQLSTSYPILFMLVSSTDHVTPQTGKSPTVTVSKNGGSFAAASGTPSEIGNGVYALAGNATDRATLGTLVIRATATGCDDALTVVEIVPYDPFAKVDANVTHNAGTAITSAAGRQEVNVTHYGGSAGTFASGRPEVNTVRLAGQTVTASGGVTFPAATLASTTNITGGTITTVSGNVTGSVGSVASGVQLATGAITASKFGNGAITLNAFATGVLPANFNLLPIYSDIDNGVFVPAALYPPHAALLAKLEGTLNVNVIQLGGQDVIAGGTVSFPEFVASQTQIDSSFGSLNEQFPENFPSLDINNTGRVATQGGDSDDAGKLDEIISMLQTDPPTVGGGQQFMNRRIVRGDTYGVGARAFNVVRHRQAEWPIDLSEWTWAIVSAKAAENDAEGDTLGGSVSVLVATGEGRSLAVSLASTDTLASGMHNYKVIGTKGSDKWSVELGVVTVLPGPAAEAV